MNYKAFFYHVVWRKSMSVATVFSATMEDYSGMDNTQELDRAQEHELVLRCQKGDVDAMGILNYALSTLGLQYRLRHTWSSPRCRRCCPRCVSSPYGKTSENSSSVPNFLHGSTRIVKNKCFNHIDQYQRRKTDPMEIDDSQPWVPLDSATPEDAALRSEEKDIVHNALSKLKDSYREILVLRELRELSYEEIAEILDCTLGRVKSRLHEARKALKTELERVVW